ncbi:hypothetical protein B0H11DRAFT_1955915 [Mycena galericulata]|nr:hypothetical protein B0H11DRAFT_1955915 [Mycena galericulata]
MNLYFIVFPTKFPDYWDFIASRTYGTCVEIFFYGVLLVLLSFAAHLLYHRPTRAGRRSLGVTTSIMAILATAQLVVHIWGTVVAFRILQLAIHGEEYPYSPSAVSATDLYANLYALEDILLVTNKSTYRCFAIWGRDLRVVILPMIMVLATTVMGYVCAYQDDYSSAGPYVDFRIAFLMSVLTNTVLMALTAGRIWWIRRDASILSDSAGVRRYTTVIAIILESGAIYCVCVIIYVVVISVLNPGNFTPLVDIFRGAIPQIMNIAPTLIIVRVGLGYGSEETVKFSDRRTAITSPARSVFAGHNPPQSLSQVIDISARRDSD